MRSGALGVAGSRPRPSLRARLPSASPQDALPVFSSFFEDDLGLEHGDLAALSPGLRAEIPPLHPVLARQSDLRSGGLGFVQDPEHVLEPVAGVIGKKDLALDRVTGCLSVLGDAPGV